MPNQSWNYRAARIGLMALYCVSIFFALDFLYSRLLYEKDRSGRTANEYYDHGFLPNFEGHGSWGALRAKLYTNSLGFKDFRVRDVPATANARRVVLIGDSFTEGIGLRFEDTFAGLLYHAGQERDDKIEFLNAAVVTYSPVIYYKKIKYLLDANFRFDELIVFSDISDVQDEATSYFCIDDHPEFRRFCRYQPAPPSDQSSLNPQALDTPQQIPGTRLEDYFVVSGKLLHLLGNEIDALTGSSSRFVSSGWVKTRAGWTMPNFDPGHSYDPLGVEGGISRSLANMQALADLLRPHGIGLTIVVYPWPYQLIENDRHSRQVMLWRDFCANNCKGFVDLFPNIFAEMDARKDWYEYLFIPGDFHYSVAGNRVIFNALAQHLL